MCSPLAVPDKCGMDIDSSHILFVADESDHCVSMLSARREDNYAELVNHRKPTKGFVTSTHHSDFEVEVRCAKGLKHPRFDLTYEGLRIETRDACGSLNHVSRIFVKREGLVHFTFLLLGIVLLFAGGYKWDILISYIGFLVGFMFMFLFFWGFVEYKETTTTYLWMVLVATTVGVILSYLFKTFVLLSYGIIGFALGFFTTKVALTHFDFNVTDVG